MTRDEIEQAIRASPTNDLGTLAGFVMREIVDRFGVEALTEGALHDPDPSYRAFWKACIVYAGAIAQEPARRGNP